MGYITNSIEQDNDATLNYSLRLLFPSLPFITSLEVTMGLTPTSFRRTKNYINSGNTTGLERFSMSNHVFYIAKLLNLELIDISLDSIFWFDLFKQ